MGGEWHRDGSFSPSWMPMSTYEQDLAYHQKRVANADTLRQGYVIAKHFPGDEGYVGLTQPLYDVQVYQYTNGRGGTPDKVSCTLAPSLGSIEDNSILTLRAPTNWIATEAEPNIPVEKTTRVLVLFMDGRTDQGVIIGCLPNEKARPMVAGEGHHSFSSFNGIETDINKDGEYTLTSTLETIDATTNEVATPDAAKAGTFFKIDKDGSVIIDADLNQINIDRPNSDINVTASNNITINATEKTYIGKTGASENLVLGKKLLDAIDKLIQILQTPPTPAIPGQVIASSAAILPLLAAWSSLHTLPNPLTSDLLAQKKFTE